MAKEITMPALSPSMNEGTLVKWLKREGEHVKQGEVIAEVETDKATMDLEAFDSGVLLKITAPAGARVLVNSRIALLGEAGEKIDETSLQKKTAAKQKPLAPLSGEELSSPSLSPAATQTVVAPISSVSNGVSRIKVSPLAKKIAQAQGIDLAQLAGTGPGGRIVKRDLLSHATTLGSGGALFGTGSVAKTEKIPLSNMRRAIARRLLESKTQIPHFYLEIEVDAAPLLQTRAGLNAALEAAKKPIKLTLNDFILKACVEALRKVPALNASFEADFIQQHGAVNISFAVAIPDGLITPVIFNAHAKSLLTISGEAKALGERAKQMALKPEEYTGGTFTVSNMGMLGVDRFSAIINPPQAAILAVGSVVKKPVVNEKDQLAIGERMSLTLSCDHRVVDGATGAHFLKELRSLVEKPALLLL